MEHGYYSPESARVGSSSTWWYKLNGDAVEIHLVAEPEWAERNFKWKDKIDLGPVSKWAFHKKPKGETMGYANNLFNPDLIYDADLIICKGKVLKDRGTVRFTIPTPPLSDEEAEYGYQPVVPDGYERVSFGVPTRGESYLPKDYPGSFVAGEDETDGHKRVIVRKKQTEEEAAYGGTVPPIPEGWERVGFDYPKEDGYYLDPISKDAQLVYFNFTQSKWIILKKKTKRFAVAKVELPEGFSLDHNSHPSSGEYWLNGYNSNPAGSFSVGFHWKVVEE